MSRLKVLSLNKKLVGELQRNEMADLTGKGLDLSKFKIDSINTRFTRVKSCCGGECDSSACSSTEQEPVTGSTSAPDYDKR